MPEEIIVQPQGDEGSKGSVGEAQETELEDDKGEGSEEEKAAAVAAAEAAKKKEEEEAAAKAPTDKELLDAQISENQELRTLLRDGKRSLDALTDRVTTSETALEKAGLVTEEEKKAVADQQSAFTAREGQLETILEMTRLNPKFEDVDTVVSQGNFDAAIDLMATEYATKNGVSVSEAVVAVESWVWSLINPYRFMYEKIKEAHPSFKGKKQGKEAPPEIPGSVQGVHGGAGNVDLTGWTAAKIDGLPEDELASVPKDVYAKYLRNELK
ncbi:MAG: hypothetical protein IMF19_04500 [Proteobacteria bacterium]|nr:hypothetical protein [Pseudomonadota bacterium]